MLTTQDLYTRPGYGIEVGDVVEFQLTRGLEFITYNNHNFKRIIVEKSSSHKPVKSLTGTITSYKPLQPGQLEIEGQTNEGYEFTLKITDCKDLTILN